MDYNELCIDCFKYTGGEEVCMNCGYIQTDKPKNICHLYPHTILHGRYIIGRVINNGGFGVVYKAYDIQLENIVAIKELLPTQNSMVTRMPPSQEVFPVNDERREQFKILKNRFMEEARMMAQFSACESIVHIYDYFETNNTAYIVMEFLDGITLREYIDQNNKKLPYEKAIELIMPIMEALNTIHKSNVIHKDVSPDNIFICNDGRIKLIDFGAAKFGESDSASIDDSVVTKPGYTPPEQYRTNSKIGFYTDIYSLGAVLYTITTGNVPEESIEREQKDHLKRPSSYENVEMPIYAEKSIMKALALKESARFKNMQDFINAIKGKKKADFPEVELKKKRIRNAVLIAMIFVLMASSVAVTYFVKNANNIIPSQSATITLWYSDSGNEGLNARWEELAADFTDFAKAQNENLADTKLEVKGIPAESYEAELKAALEAGNGPDIFQATSDSFDEYSASLDNVYSESDKQQKKSEPYDNIKKLFKAENKIAACFDVPIMYVYTDDTDNKAPESTAELKDIAAIKPNDIFKYSLITNPDAVLESAYAYDGAKTGDDDALATLYKTSVIFDKDNKYVEPQSVFIKQKNNAMYYIGYMSEYSTIAKNIRVATSSFSICELPGNSTTVYYSYPEIWSISKDSKISNKRTSALFLYFITSTKDGQRDTVMVNSNTYYLPILPESIDNLGYEDYKNVIYNGSNEVYKNDYKSLMSINAKSDKAAKIIRTKDSAFEDVKAAVQ